MSLTVIEMEYMRSQIAQAKAIHENLPHIVDMLQRIAIALETSQGYTAETLSQESLDELRQSLLFAAAHKDEETK